MLKWKIRKPKKARPIKRESDDGCIEYKIKLCHFDTPNRMDKLTSQMKFRLYEGEGRAIYNLGYTDDGFPCGLNNDLLFQSLNNLFSIVDILNAEIKSVNILRGKNGFCANIYVISNQPQVLLHDTSIVDLF